MIDFTILPIYLLAVLALLLIPGPDMLLIASSSLAYGKKVGLSASLGNCTSGLILTLLASMGVSTIIAVNPLALEALKLLGGAYLLKMGWDCFRVESVDTSKGPDENRQARALYKKAVFSNLLNPKALLFFTLFLPQFVSSQITASSGEQMLVLGLILNALGLTFNLILVAFVGSLGTKLLGNPSFLRYQHKAMGAIFVIMALWLLFSQMPSQA
ncbi:LysE family translocator [Vibrio sp. Of7-15]|uniref:LysE family translocator n=1 Tax=Vibrio sp. Of7-15 TaxID=2724879 RepID=UPI001EF32566|nr:LysE family translocator [Vibrio sp. Of7-15]MCG7497797.1 LysE family translocator [Vibrio sp. Of7-15]